MTLYRDRAVSLFQRIKTPFSDRADDHPARPQSRTPAVGALLRERREEFGLDLDAIGEALRIKPVYLAALEQGRAQDLPGPTYAIGFIRSYAEYLGLDSARILDSYKAETAEIHARPDLSLPVPLGARSLPGGALLLVGMILALCGYGTWFYLSTGERTRPERVAAVPAELREAAAAQRLNSGLSSGLLAPPDASPALAVPAPGSPSPGLVANPAAASLTPPASLPPARSNSAGASPAPVSTGSSAAPSGDPGANPGANLAANPVGRIDIRALADCWIQVRSANDQSIVFSRVLKTGETYRVPRAGLILRTGNAGALAVVVDGKAVPAIGGVGTLRRSVALDPEALLAGTAVRG